MNTANLQMTGVLAGLGALVGALRASGAVEKDSLDQALKQTEAAMIADAERTPELSPANVEATLFPIRFLRVANALYEPGKALPFSRVTAEVGRLKDQ